MKVIIFLNANTVKPQTIDAQLRDAELLIGADGGANLCAQWQITPDIVMGDFDSINPDLLHFYKQQPGIELFQHPTRKNQTDLELAVDQAVSRGASKILLAGALGNRWDMSLANLFIGGQEKYQDIAFTVIDPDCFMALHRPGVTHCFSDLVGRTISFLPLAGTVFNLHLRGFEYTLAGENLTAGSSRGISNTITSSSAALDFSEGLLISIILGSF